MFLVTHTVQLHFSESISKSFNFSFLLFCESNFAYFAQYFTFYKSYFIVIILLCSPNMFSYLWGTLSKSAIVQLAVKFMYLVRSSVQPVIKPINN